MKMEESGNVHENPPATAVDTSENIKTENAENFEPMEVETAKVEPKSEEDDKGKELNKNALIAVLQFLKKHNLQVCIQQFIYA